VRQPDPKKLHLPFTCFIGDGRFCICKTLKGTDRRSSLGRRMAIAKTLVVRVRSPSLGGLPHNVRSWCCARARAGHPSRHGSCAPSGGRPIETSGAASPSRSIVVLLGEVGEGIPHRECGLQHARCTVWLVPRFYHGIMLCVWAWRILWNSDGPSINIGGSGRVTVPRRHLTGERGMFRGNHFFASCWALASAPQKG
jgi:hypothetical protein